MASELIKLQHTLLSHARSMWLTPKVPCIFCIREASSILAACTRKTLSVPRLCCGVFMRYIDAHLAVGCHDHSK